MIRVKTVLFALIALGMAAFGLAFLRLYAMSSDGTAWTFGRGAALAAVFIFAGLLAMSLWLWRADVVQHRQRSRIANEMKRVIEGGATETSDIVATDDPLVARALELLDRLAATRRSLLEAVEDARSEAKTQLDQLEAVLSDLSEGVVVCDEHHRLQLYNRAALWFLDGASPPALGRPIGDLIRSEPIERGHADLIDAVRRDPTARHTTSLLLRTPSGASLSARLALVADGAHSNDYVLTISDRSDPPAEKIRRKNRQTPRRKVAYDFTMTPGSDLPDEILQRRLRDLQFSVFDTETTGLKASEGDVLVSLAAVRVVNGRLRRDECIDLLINPGQQIPESSTQIHGITDSMVADAPPAGDVIRNFRDFAAGDVLVAHNAAFDMSFIVRGGQPAGIGFDNPVIDTMLISAYLDPDLVDHSLDGLAKRLDVTPENRHSALGDALTTAEIFLRMLPRLEARGVSTLGSLFQATEMRLGIKRMAESF